MTKASSCTISQTWQGARITSSGAAAARPGNCFQQMHRAQPWSLRGTSLTPEAEPGFAPGTKELSFPSSSPQSLWLPIPSTYLPNHRWSSPAWPQTARRIQHGSPPARQERVGQQQLRGTRGPRSNRPRVLPLTKLRPSRHGHSPL